MTGRPPSLFAWLSCLCLLAQPAMAAPLDDPDVASAPPDPLFTDQAHLSITLEGPLEALLRDRDPEPEERPATLSWHTAAGGGSLAVEIRPRGKSRRNPDICRFPPIRLNIRTGDAKGTLFEEQDKLKLVTHCDRLESRSDRSADWVALEYFAYRILNALTDYSFRVRPLAITYVTETGERFEHPAFLIEDKDRLAARHGLEVSERQRITPAAQAPTMAQLVEVFEYMIGNTDFSLLVGPPEDRCCHNAVLLTDGEGFVPVPYDFDFTGLVNRPGAQVADGLGISRVTQRLFRGLCRGEDVLDDVLARFRAAREEIETILADEITLSARARRRTMTFIDRFYDVLESERRIDREFVQRCRSVGDSG